MAISVAQALQFIAEDARSLGTESVSLDQLTGRVLAEALIADRPFPPFDRVMMDGIALRAEAFEQGARHFPVEAFQPAGESARTLEDAQACIETATGAVLPEGCDSVVMYEELELVNGVAQLKCEAVVTGQHVHPTGHDRSAGEVIVPAGTVCRAAEHGVAATVGKTDLQVARQPRTILVSTGDELVSVASQPAPHQIRRSNVHALDCLLEIPVEQVHLPDDKEAVMEFFKQSTQGYDLIVLCGAVSKGKRDYIPEVLESLGANKAFHGVAQRPGKPMWFGRLEAVTIFGLPGNPVSAFACGLRYVRTWIQACQGIQPDLCTARLVEEVLFTPALTYFLPVRLSNGEATPIPGHGSGDLANLALADGFLELPADRNTFSIGESFPVFTYR